MHESNRMSTSRSIAILRLALCTGAGALGCDGTTGMSMAPGTGSTSTSSYLAEGGSHACAVLSGSIKCWGRNHNGQLGNNSADDGFVAVPVQGLQAGGQAVAAGDIHSCAVANGKVMCWGDNQYGQLGNNSTQGSSVPVAAVGLPAGVQSITAGHYHTLCVGRRAGLVLGLEPGWATGE